MTFAELVMMPYLFSIENLIKKKLCVVCVLEKLDLTKKEFEKEKNNSHE